jgi:ATP-dependent Clp protease protease subunit
VKTIIPFPKSAAAKWFDFRNAKDESVDLFIYDVVGDSWTGNDAAALVKEIAGYKKKRINARINSPGGSVFDGVAIFNALKNHDGGVTTFIDGLAASIASIIALAGDRIVMADNAMMMIHNPSSFSFGEAKDLRKDADILDQIKETLINAYVTKTGKQRDAVASDMDKETWFTASEAKAYGLVTEVTESMKMAACVDEAIANIFGFRNAPSGVIKAQNIAPTASSATPRSLFERRQALLEKLTK